MPEAQLDLCLLLGATYYVKLKMKECCGKKDKRITVNKAQSKQSGIQ